LDFPCYSPPTKPPSTVAEAKARLAELRELLLAMTKCIEAANARRLDGLVEDFKARRKPVRAERVKWDEAVAKTRSRALGDGYSGTVDELPLVEESPAAVDAA
jgi:hypothetical protein